jgi:hypothetical protein
VIFTCRKILRRGASGFTSPPKEGVLQVFIALENTSPQPRTLVLTASTLSMAFLGGCGARPGYALFSRLPRDDASCRGLQALCGGRRAGCQAAALELIAARQSRELLRPLCSW